MGFKGVLAQKEYHKFLLISLYINSFNMTKQLIIYIFILFNYYFEININYSPDNHNLYIYSLVYIDKRQIIKSSNLKFNQLYHSINKLNFEILRCH